MTAAATANARCPKASISITSSSRRTHVQDTPAPSTGRLYRKLSGRGESENR